MKICGTAHHFSQHNQSLLLIQTDCISRTKKVSVKHLHPGVGGGDFPPTAAKNNLPTYLKDFPPPGIGNQTQSSST